MRAERVAVTGSVVNGILASACCIGPLVFALLGISGATFAQRFEPFRPYLLPVTYAHAGARLSGEPDVPRPPAPSREKA